MDRFLRYGAPPAAFSGQICRAPVRVPADFAWSPPGAAIGLNSYPHRALLEDSRRRPEDDRAIAKYGTSFLDRVILQALRVILGAGAAR